MSIEEAEELYEELPKKHQGLTNAFPKCHGGIRQDTETIYDRED